MTRMSDSKTSVPGEGIEASITYRPYAFDPPANPMGNKMTTDFGNPDFDGRVFQIDRTYQRFIENYDTVRQSGHLDAYVGEDHLKDNVQEAVCRFLAETLVAEYPEIFRLHTQGNGHQFENRLLDEVIHLDQNFRYVRGGRFVYRNAIDALAAQIPEDMAIVQVNEEQDRLAAVHVVAPSGWNPREKLGGSFVEVHHPVHHQQRWLKKVQAGVRNIAKTDQPLQRFGWSITNDANLDHHPDYGGASGPSRIDGEAPLFVRVERQVLKGFPEVFALLFTIRVYIERCAELPQSDRATLRSAIEAMGPEERAYKGIKGNSRGILRLLE